MNRAAGRMDVIGGIDALTRDVGRLFVVVGVFDGLHRGHAYLLRELRHAAARRRAKPAVLTFDHHPDEILAGAAPPLLCDPEERLSRLERAGVSVTIVQHFDLALRMTSFDAFVTRLDERVELAGFLMTPDSAFGFERRGTPDAVAGLGRALGYDVELVAPLELDGRAVRSSDIRAAIAAGDLARAARGLGRPVSVTGRSKRLAAATELRTELPVALPPDGAYAAVAVSSGDRTGVRRRLVVRSDRVTLEPPLGVPDGVRVRARLPVPTQPATIRRS